MSKEKRDKTNNPQANSTILIVEDSEIQAVMLKRILVQNGYTVTWAKNGADGFAAALKQRPTLIISDIMMPVMDGYQMCREIKLQETLKDLPILLLTQLIEPEEVIRGLEAGADNYITKPYNEDFLISKVKSILENPEQFKNKPQKKCIEFDYEGKHYTVHAGRTQTLSFLLTTYENAVLQNKELMKIQVELMTLNEHLDEKVKERTITLTTEIANRKKAEGEVRESEEKLHIITATAGDAIMMIDDNGLITFWNKAAEKIFGYKKDEAMGKNIHRLIVPEKYYNNFEKGFIGFRETGQGAVIGKTLELEAKRKDGMQFFTEHTISAVNIKGKWHAIGVARDITERKRVQNELKQSYDKMRDILEETALALSSSLEMRDAYTAGHQRRVTLLACAIASEMGLSEEQIKGIRVAGILHDIGKISVPAEILSKPGKLGKMEFELIKGHVNAGYEILKHIEFPWPVAQIVLQHHENMEGSGYPSGLSGGQILIEARILCVSDVVEAMSSHRPYRPALGIDAALKEITKGKGVLYDPAVVDVCLKLFKKKGFMFE